MFGKKRTHVCAEKRRLEISELNESNVVFARQFSRHITCKCTRGVSRTVIFLTL